MSSTATAGEERARELNMTATDLVVLLSLLVDHEQLEALLPDHRLDVTASSVSQAVWFWGCSLVLALLALWLVGLARRLALGLVPDVL